MSHFNTEPLTNVDILKDELPCLVNNLVIENILPHLKQFLSFDEQETISSARTQSAKTLATIDLLTRRTSCKSYEAFNAFFKILAGTQPELFTFLVGRPPNVLEVDFCIDDFTVLLKRDIKDKGHKTDSILDEEIDLDSQYAQLQIIKNDENSIDFPKTDIECWHLTQHDHQLPHDYQHFLSHKEEKSKSVCDILTLGKNDNKKILLSGRAGVGKTTTLQWLARQWALGRWATGFTVLFLLQLRLLSHPDSHVTAIELLMLCGLFQAEHDANVLCSWLKNASSRLIILIDGLDEISAFAQRMENTPKITELDRKAHPIDILINILCGNLLSGCTIICTSRPFKGLSALPSYNVLEILGLSQKQVKAYVGSRHPHQAENIMSVLKRNPILMSVCCITFYCMAVSSLLNCGVAFMDDDFKTYSRLTAFIVVQHLSRKLSEWPFVIEASPYFGKLAHLAFKGIFESYEPYEQGISKVTFNEYDLAEVGLTPSELQKTKDVGILQFKEMGLRPNISLSAEFLHLTLQELLAAAHRPIKINLKHMYDHGQFNMVLMYLFGLQYDKNSKWIKNISMAVSPSSHCTDSDIDENISEFLEEICSKNKETDTLKVCQLVHEGQVDNLAKSVVDYVAPDGKLEIGSKPMTGIDLMAVAFVCQVSHTLTEITFYRVNADDTFVEILSSSLIKVHINSLQSLSLTHNSISAQGIKALAEAVHQSQCLKRLDVSGNQSGDDGAKALADTLLPNKGLQELKVSNNHISCYGIKAIAEAMHDDRTLTKLDISWNTIGDEGACLLGQAFKVNQSLHELCVGSSDIRESGTMALAEALENNDSLTILDLSFNNIGPHGAAALAKALLTNRSLQELFLKGNIPGGKMYTNCIDDKGAVAIAEALHINVSLQKLDVSCSSIGVRGAVAITEALHINLSLQHLSVSSNNIGAEGAVAIATALHTNVSLKDLDISGTHIGNEGAKALGGALCTNNSLQKLWLCSNDISDEGAVALAEALHTNVCLESLSLDYNNIGDSGAEALAQALSTNKCLKELSLLKNQVGNKGAFALAEALKTNEPLKGVEVSDCTSPFEVVGTVKLKRTRAIAANGAAAQALHPNTGLKHLDLEQTNIGEEGSRALVEASSSLECIRISNTEECNRRFDEYLEYVA